MLKKKIPSTIVSDFHDWYVEVPADESKNMLLANRTQCRAYKKFIQTLGLEARIFKREYSDRKSEGGFVTSVKEMS